MALDSREIMLEKFVTVNKARYPDYTDRLGKVTVDTMQFETIATDPNNPIMGRVANLASSSLQIEAEEQSWECAPIGGDRVLNFSDKTLYATLEDISLTKSRGLYRFKTIGEKIPTVVQVIPLISTDTSVILKAALDDLNAQSKYKLKASEITVKDQLSNNLYRMLVNGDTIYGEFYLVCSDPYSLKAGTWLKGYYGQVLPRDFMSPEAVTSLLGISNDKILYTGDNLWLKFSYNGKIVMIAQKPTANMLSYNDLADLSLVKGDRVIEIGGDNYNVRIPRSDSKADGTNEWEDLLYHVSASDPDKVFWEQFSDNELGMGYTASSGTRNKGEWNWIYRSDLTLQSTVIRGGQGTNTGVLSKTTSLLTLVTLNRGFRPVLIMQGANGIVVEPTWFQPEPKRLEPVDSNTYGVTDAHPIKRAVLSQSVLPPEFDYASIEAVSGIYTFQVAKDEKVPAPLYHDTVISDTITRVMGLDFGNYQPAPMGDGYRYGDLIKGLYSPPVPRYYTGKVVPGPVVASGAVTPVRKVDTRFLTPQVPATTSYGNLIKGLYVTPIIDVVGVSPVGFSSEINDAVRSVRVVTPRLATPAFSSFAYTNTIKTLGAPTIKPVVRAPLPSVSIDYSGNPISMRVVTGALSSPRALTSAPRPPTVIVPATNYSELGK